MPNRTGSARVAWLHRGTAVVMMAALTGACGTRVEGPAAVGPSLAAAPASEGSASPNLGAGSSVSSTPKVAEVGASPAGSATQGGIMAPDAPSVSARPRMSVSPTGATEGSKATPSSPSNVPVASVAGERSGGSVAQSTTTATLPAETGPRSTVLIASVGTYSGPAGATLKPIVLGAQLWVNSVNWGRGLNGHQAQLLVYDDSADPARHRAQVQEAIEQKHVLALLATIEGFAGNEATAQYINSKRVPVIGSEGSADYFYEFPMFFPQQTHGAGFFYSAEAAAAGLVVSEGRTKLGSIVCAEVQACANGGQVWEKYAGELGLQMAYQARASIAQPDFSGVCLAARNAGAQTLLLSMDANSVSRLSTSCARQDYLPQYGVVTSIAEASQVDDPNLKNMIASTSVFPYFQSNTPATAEFHEAVKLVGGGSLRLGNGTATGWTAGKLLEKAAANLPEPPTSDAILKGLWSMKDDTLGGLTLPLTFSENQLPERRACWFTTRIVDGKWTSPNNFRLDCRKTPLPKGF